MASDSSGSNAGVSALQKVPFLAGLDRDDLEGIADRGETVSFRAGDTIVQRGDPGDALYVVLDGRAQVDVGGRFHEFKPGDFFGEMGVIAGRPRTATVKAADAVAALRVPAEAFQSFVVEHPRAALAMMKSLVERLREVQERVDSWMGAW
jgi:CRP/FNR family transcriptional regulator, cyclic AMP receptor protein